MPMVVTPAPRRNEPCPCGSNRRFKDCHGRLARGAAFTAAQQLRATGDLERAMSVVQQALQGPDDIEALDLAGMIAHDLLHLDMAEGYFRQAVEKAPAFAEAHYHLSICLLLRGDYRRGWEEYAWRTGIPGPANFANVDFGFPRWKG